MKQYIGIKTLNDCKVTVLDENHPDESYMLNARFDLRNHSPDGFSRSYFGSSPAQLSLALLADALGDDERALSLYQRFKARVVGRLEGDRFDLSQEEIRRTATQLEAEELRGR